ncbi:helix-turn-helix domain-containing protein [Cupriavidus pauculus]|uniref:helix-turn-helix domain-containing protein n=1 Tax=Cupriavidus pauculus TaxID=82633 RepID=UPI001CC32183|nr:helix-turn-helix domain-containing protein [Cupriavidus pauculus]
MKVIQAVADGHLARWCAAEKLSISRRPVERLAQRYRQDGPRGLLSRKWGQAGHRQLAPRAGVTCTGLDPRPLRGIWPGAGR